MTLEQAVRADRDGCGCPPWVVRCVHWDGKILVLCEGGPQNTDCPTHTYSSANFQVGLFEGQWVACPGCQDSVVRSETVLGGVGADDLPAAEAEFKRRAEEMRVEA